MTHQFQAKVFEDGTLPVEAYIKDRSILWLPRTLAANSFAVWGVVK